MITKFARLEFELFTKPHNLTFYELGNRYRRNDSKMKNMNNDINLPKMIRIRQKFEAPVLENISREIFSQIDEIRLPSVVKKGESVAVGCSSRSIANYAEIVKAMNTEPGFLYSKEGIITVETFTKKKDTGEQKFWVFSVSYRKYTKETIPGTSIVVAHFVSGSYVSHDGRQVLQITPSPLENLNFLGTFPVTQGAFELK